MALSLDLNGAAIEKANNTVESESDPYYKSQAVARRETLRKEKTKILGRFQVAKQNLDEVRQDVAEKVGRSLVNDVCKYQHALNELTTNEGTEYYKLEELAASIANTGPVQEGKLAIVPYDDKMQKAKVRSVDADGRVAVSIWTTLETDRNAYEEGYDTSKPVIESFPRHQVYVHAQKHRQSITASTLDAVLACCSSPYPDQLKKFLQHPKRPEFLMALYADATETRTHLVELAAQVALRVNGPVDSGAAKVEAQVPSVKGIARATVKTKEKYGGCYDCLTDLARMTFVCENVATVIAVLTFIYGHSQWTIIRIKDRLHRNHDASATGGYRDMLLNVRDNASGHIAEIQITFRSFFTIKSGGGHAVYKLARLLELNEEETTYFMGKIDENIVGKIGSGSIDGQWSVSE